MEERTCQYIRPGGRSRLFPIYLASRTELRRHGHFLTIVRRGGAPLAMFIHNQRDSASDKLHIYLPAILLIFSMRDPLSLNVLIPPQRPG